MRPGFLLRCTIRYRKTHNEQCSRKLAARLAGEVARLVVVEERAEVALEEGREEVGAEEVARVVVGRAVVEMEGKGVQAAKVAKMAARREVATKVTVREEVVRQAAKVAVREGEGKEEGRGVLVQTSTSHHQYQCQLSFHRL